ncbi:MAG: DUF4907 domain-containing protein [Bacteroidetes bacterium]|jgi:hypothetical protein|nr:DUF4907 domain-containing protein [Bacteroidota bacterium]
MKKWMLIALLAVAACSSDKKNQQPQEQIAPLNNISYKTFANDSAPGGFGYDIFVDGRMMVHQPNIPAVMGNRGFTSETDAAKTAELVMHKLKNNIMPPSVTTAELDSLGIK